MNPAAGDRPSATGSTSTGGRNDVTVALDAASATQAQQQFHSAFIQYNFIAMFVLPVYVSNKF